MTPQEQWRAGNRGYPTSYYRQNAERLRVLGNKRYHEKGIRFVRHGITRDQYDDMVSKQNNKCAICKRSFEVRNPNIDHCHDTGKVRGLLCNPCNTYLGAINDNPSVLVDAIEYITQ